MRIVVATTSGFHLRHLAREMILAGQDAHYISYLPKFRIAGDGIPLERADSLFMSLQPWATGALFRYSQSIQTRCVETMLARTDLAIAEMLPRCDIFIGLSGMAIRSAECARKKYGARVIIERGSRHVMSQNALISENGNRPLTNQYIERELESYSVADYIALPSIHAAQSFIERGFLEKQLFVNMYGVDLARFSFSPCPPLPMRLLFVGSWSHQKGADVMSEALNRLPNCTLTHVGMKTDVPFPTSDRFTSLGHVSQDRLREVYADHHILLLPSRQDGFGMVILEALACGLYIVASQMTGGPDVREMLGNKNAVRLVSAGSVNEIVDAVSGLEDLVTASQDNRTLLGEKEKAVVSWKSYAARYIDFLREIAPLHSPKASATPR
jgi:glycosyltransferase involved in cell wall biosynthesis